MLATLPEPIAAIMLSSCYSLIIHLSLVMLFFMIFLTTLPVFADYEPSSMINISVENDVGSIGGPGTDHGYTQGLKFSYVATTEHQPTFLNFMTHDSLAKTNLGFGVSQKLFTPAGIDNSNLIQDDRPYAAWLAADVFYHFQSEHQSQLIALSLGIIGPEALGENMQNSYHKATNYMLAEGWHHQLATEPTAEISYQQRNRFYEFNKSEHNKTFDAITLVGGDIGNVLIDGYFGAMVRYGYNVPTDLGPTRPSLLNGERFLSENTQIEDRFYFYSFAAARVIGVGRNIFLDGNTFKSSHRVKKRLAVLENEIGVSLNYNNLNLTWRFVTATPEFEEKNEHKSFASISLSYRQ